MPLPVFGCAVADALALLRNLTSLVADQFTHGWCHFHTAITLCNHSLFSLPTRQILQPGQRPLATMADAVVTHHVSVLEVPL